jgi:UDP-3-O-acyl-N-acetylglucosamine deacetylase
VFRRVNLPDAPEIPACAAALNEQPRRTSLQRGAAEVHTCEHLLAAAWALGIDNLIVELNAAELPGCDGSALDFAEALMGAGSLAQRAPRMWTMSTGWHRRRAACTCLLSVAYCESSSAINPS